MANKKQSEQHIFDCVNERIHYTPTQSQSDTENDYSFRVYSDSSSSGGGGNGTGGCIQLRAHSSDGKADYIASKLSVRPSTRRLFIVRPSASLPFVFYFNIIILWKWTHAKRSGGGAAENKS